MAPDLVDPAGPGQGAERPMVKAEAVHKSFGHLQVLKGIDLEVRPNQVVVLLGPSGSGKSTFLRCINHLEQINGGRLWVDGELVGYREEGGKLHELRDREVARKRAEIGMVFQRFNLFPHMTALENVCEAPCQVKGTRKDEARRRGQELLDQVGLADKADVYPMQLSGGQQQRVAIARALAMDPKLMLFDEPTSAPGPSCRGSSRQAPGPREAALRWSVQTREGPARSRVAFGAVRTFPECERSLLGPDPYAGRNTGSPGASTSLGGPRSLAS